MIYHVHRQRVSVANLPVLSPDQKDEVRRMCDEQGRSLREIAQLFRVSTMTIRWYKNCWHRLWDNIPKPIDGAE